MERKEVHHKKKKRQLLKHSPAAACLVLKGVRLCYKTRWKRHRMRSRTTKKFHSSTARREEAMAVNIFHYDCVRKEQTCTAHSFGGLFLRIFSRFSSFTCFLLFAGSLFCYEWCSWMGNVDFAFRKKFSFGKIRKNKSLNRSLIGIKIHGFTRLEKKKSQRKTLLWGLKKPIFTTTTYSPEVKRAWYLLIYKWTVFF